MAEFLFIFIALISFSNCKVPSDDDYNELDVSLNCGFVVTPTHSNFNEYASSSVSTFDSTNIPASIVMAGCEQDVVITMDWLQPFLDSVSFTIRSGGHSFGGYSKADGAILIDLSQMKDIDVIQGNKISVEPGVKQGEYQAWKVNNTGFKYTFPHGVSPLPAIGGFATGGGIGLTTRQWGVTCDYIYGVRVVLCDGSLWQIFENDNTNTKCLQQCDSDNNIDLDNDDLQDLIYAIKGGGGGNFGVITKYYFNTVPDPQFPMFFSMLFPVDSRDTIFNSFIAFRNILMDDFEDNNNFALLAIVGVNPDPTVPFFMVVFFSGVYLSETSDTTIFNQIIGKIQEYMQSPPAFSTVETTITLTEIYTNILFPILGSFTYRSYFSSRLLYEETLGDIDATYFDIVSDYLYETLPMLAADGVVLSMAIESLGGLTRGTSVSNKQTSFPKQNRNALAITEANFIVPIIQDETHEDVASRLTTAKSSRDLLDQQVLSLAGNKKYLNYIDDITNDLTLYYSVNEINKLAEIQEEIDPNACFAFKAGINGGQIGGESDESDESDESNDGMFSAFIDTMENDKGLSGNLKYHWTIDLTAPMLFTLAFGVIVISFGIVVCCNNCFKHL